MILPVITLPKINLYSIYIAISKIYIECLLQNIIPFYLDKGQAGSLINGVP